LLVHFVGAPVGKACDLGTGVGVIALALALNDPRAEIVAAELQPRLAELARKNAVENNLDSRVSIVEVDLAKSRRALPGAAFDVVVSNPPYQPLETGPANPDDEAAIARHELRLTLADLIREMKRLCKPNGRVALIYPTDRLATVLASLASAGLRPLRMRMVHDRPSENARRVMIEARKGGKGPLVVEPPLILRDGEDYTPEARRLLGENA
jgi:tRNA1Val (adenine37-N6)-methyltransferase